MDSFSISQIKKNPIFTVMQSCFWCASERTRISTYSAAALPNEIVYRFLNDLVCLFHNLSCVRKCVHPSIIGHGYTRTHCIAIIITMGRLNKQTNRHTISLARDRFRIGFVYCCSHGTNTVVDVLLSLLM